MYALHYWAPSRWVSRVSICSKVTSLCLPGSLQTPTAKSLHITGALKFGCRLFGQQCSETLTGQTETKPHVQCRIPSFLHWRPHFQMPVTSMGKSETGPHKNHFTFKKWLLFLKKADIWRVNHSHSKLKPNQTNLLNMTSSSVSR